MPNGARHTKLYHFFFPCNPSAQLFEKFRHQRLAFGGQHPARDRRARMEPQSFDGRIAPLGVVGAPHHACRLAPRDGSGAHHARLDGDVERALAQILAAERRRGRSQCLHLGMGRGILQRLHEVVTPPHDAVARHHDGADGHLRSLQRLPRFVYCQPHELFIALRLFPFRHDSDRFAAAALTEKIRLRCRNFAFNFVFL